MTFPERPWHSSYPEGVDPHFTPKPDSLTNILHRCYLQHADLLMIEYYGQRFTYREMHAQICRAAEALKAAGIQKGDRVALHLPNSPWHPIFFLGTLWMGGVVTHLSPLDAERELEFKIRDCGAKLVISLTTPEFQDRFKIMIKEGNCPPLYLCPDPVSAKGRDCPVIPGARPIAELLEGFEATPLPPVEVQPRDLAVLQYTGGTTGIPKAAMLSHSNLACAQQIYHEFSKDEPAHQPGASTLFFAPLFHILGLSSGLIRRSAEGCTFYLRQRFDAEAAVREIEEKKINSMAGVPTTWIAVLSVADIDTRDLSSLNYIGSGGAPLPRDVFDRVRSLTGLKLRGGWGMTETAPAGTAVPVRMPDDKLGTIGIPLCGLDMKIVDVDDCERELGPGVQGEMVIKGPNVTRGYWNRSDEENAALFNSEGYFLTGDIGYMDEDGWFYIVDRKKELILSGGFNVYPQLIENAIHQHPDVSDAMVIGVPDEYRGESAKAFVVLNAGAERFTLDELNKFLSDKLGRHEIPRHLEFREVLPRTAVGKSSRKMLKDQELAKSGQ